jgi:hypothetical protein
MTRCPFGPCRILSDFGSRDEPLVVLVLLVRLRVLAINVWSFSVRRLMG